MIRTALTTARIDRRTFFGRNDNPRTVKDARGEEQYIDDYVVVLLMPLYDVHGSIMLIMARALFESVGYGWTDADES